MAAKEKNIKKHADFSKEMKEMIAGTYIEWGKSKEQIWAELEQRMETKQPAGRSIFMNTGLRLAIAAAIVLLVGLGLFMQLYTKTMGMPAGEHGFVFLSDGSKIHINAQSSITYKPLLYFLKFSRKVRFEGEAYFEVEPGKKFEVVSDKGKTTVLGTSFNIYSRNNDYQVTCVTGKVMVTETQNNKTIILNPGQQAALNRNGLLDVNSGVNTDQTISWLNNILNFTSTPLPKVFEEVGRQYGVVIQYPGDLDNIYTGTFKGSTNVETALDLICKPFNLNITRTSEDEYIISRNQ